MHWFSLQETQVSGECLGKPMAHSSNIASLEQQKGEFQDSSLSPIILERTLRHKQTDKSKTKLINSTPKFKLQAHRNHY